MNRTKNTESKSNKFYIDSNKYKSIPLIPNKNTSMYVLCCIKINIIIKCTSSIMYILYPLIPFGLQEN